MIFLELVLKNFGPYWGRQSIKFSPEQEGPLRPIVLLGGMNGGGKTTLMDAIRLAFYGQRAQCSTRGSLSYSDFLTQCVNHQTKGVEETEVELTFQHVYDNVPAMFRIRRTWTRNPKNGKDSLAIAIDTSFESSLTKTWDEWIENILPLGISNLFLFDGEQVKELAELDSPPQQVVEAIQALLGLELAERLAVDLDVLVNRKRKALASAKTLETLEKMEEKLEREQQEYEAAKQALSQLQNQLSRAQRKQRRSADKFITEGGKIAAERSQLESQIKNLEEEKLKRLEAMCELAETALPLSLISPLLEQAKKQGDRELKRQQALAAREVVRERDDRLLSYLSQLSLSAVKVKKIKAFLEEENRELEDAIAPEEESWLGADEKTLEQLSQLLAHQLPQKIQIAEERREQLKNLEEELNATETQLQVAASPEAYKTLENKLKESQKELANAKIAYEAGKQTCEQFNREIAQTKKELERYSQQNIDSKNDEHIIHAAAKVQETLKQFRDRLTLKKLNKLEVEVTECFRYLLHKSNLVHRIAIETHTFRLSLYDPQGQPVPKNRLSAGEKQLLAIAFLWGLARVSGRNLPVAIDTPLGRLDSSHRSNLVERYFPAASSQVILLSTDTEIGKTEVVQLREQDAIAREYLLEYDGKNRQTTVKEGYFW